MCFPMEFLSEKTLENNENQISCNFCPKNEFSDFITELKCSEYK